MKKELSYKEAYEKLELLVTQLEEGNVPLEKLTLKVKQANDLIELCEEQLRGVETEVKKTISPTTTKKKK